MGDFNHFCPMHDSGKHLTGVLRSLNVMMKFSPDLVARVRGALERVGYCFLSYDELRRLLGHCPENRQTRHQALQEFAGMCGAEVETTPNLKSARFVPLGRDSANATCLESMVEDHAA
jgi:hypothetical protein